MVTTTAANGSRLNERNWTTVLTGNLRRVPGTNAHIYSSPTHLAASRCDEADFFDRTVPNRAGNVSLRKKKVAHAATGLSMEKPDLEPN
jgi:hypothetical protein